MTVNELVEMLKKKAKTWEEEIKFLSYEWDDDLENCSYHERDFKNVHRKKDTIEIYISR